MVETVSLYFHIPFCTKKCSYCHFFVVKNDPQEHKKLFQAFKKELSFYQNDLQGKKISSIYFGGGTPALISPHLFEDFIATLSPSSECEITIEANPKECTKELLNGFFQAGINRLSLGVQSFHAQELKLLTRTHSGQDSIQLIESASRSGFKNISIDLMYELPDQTLELWEKTLETAIQLPIQHISLYNLQIEENSAFYRKKAQLEKRMPPSDISIQMYQLMQKKLIDANFHQYEISAFSKPGFQSIHNTGYWKARPFIGIGPSAFSYWNKKRFQNTANLPKYLEKINSNLFAIDFEEQLEPDHAQAELLAIRLRLLEGVNIRDFSPLNPLLEKRVEHLISLGFLLKEGSKLRLAPSSLLVYDEIASELLKDFAL